MSTVMWFAGVLICLSLVVCGVTGEHFISVVDGAFVDGRKPFLVVGWNQWEVIEAAAGVPDLKGSSLPPGKTGPQVIPTALLLSDFLFRCCEI